MPPQPSRSWQDYMATDPAATPSAAGGSNPWMTGVLGLAGLGAAGVGAKKGFGGARNAVQWARTNPAGHWASLSTASPAVGALGGLAGVEAATRATRGLEQGIGLGNYRRQVDEERNKQNAWAGPFAGAVSWLGDRSRILFPGASAVQDKRLSDAANAPDDAPEAEDPLVAAAERARQKFATGQSAMGVDPTGEGLAEFDAIAQGILNDKDLTVHEATKLLDDMATETVQSTRAANQQQVLASMLQAASARGASEGYGQYASQYADQAIMSAMAQASLMEGYAKNAEAQGRPDIADFYRYSAANAVTQAQFAAMNDVSRAQSKPFNTAFSQQINALTGALRQQASSGGGGSGSLADFEALLAGEGVAPQGPATQAGGLDATLMAEALGGYGSGSAEDLAYMQDYLGY